MVKTKLQKKHDRRKPAMSIAKSERTIKGKTKAKLKQCEFARTCSIFIAVVVVGVLSFVGLS